VVSVWCRFGVLGRFSGKERAGNLYWTWGPTDTQVMSHERRDGGNNLDAVKNRVDLYWFSFSG